MVSLLHQWSGLLASLPRKTLGLGAWLLVMALVFGALERWGAVRRRRFWRPAVATDIGYYFLGGLLPPFFTVAAAAVVVWLASGLVPASAYAWVGQQPLWLRVVVMIVLGDVAFYWAHRWSHEVPLLWSLHVIHHSPTDIDWLVNTRAHPLDLVFVRVVSALPILALGLRQSAADLEAIIALYLTVTTVWAFFVHTNLDWRLGWLEQVVVTPAFHHWHHADETPAALNKNYASLFPWLDRLFGTYNLPDRFPASYGAQRRLPDTLAGQLWSPFARLERVNESADVRARAESSRPADPQPRTRSGR